MKIQRASFAPYALPFVVPIPSADGPQTERHGWLVRLLDGDGRAGYGDAAHWPGFGANADTVAADLRRLVSSSSQLASMQFEKAGDIRSWLSQQRVSSPAAYAIELALLDLLAQRAGRSLARMLTATPLDCVPVHALVFDGPSAHAAAQHGVRAVKIKVGRAPLHVDDARLAEIRAATGPAMRLRVDANGAWSRDDARRALTLLARHDIELFEQPVAADDIEGLAWLRRETGARIAADESLSQRRDLDALLAANAIDVAVVKPMFAGGVQASLDLITRARGAGIEVIVTHALESAVGRCGAAHVAAAIGDPTLVHGLTRVVAEDVADLPEVRDGCLPLPQGAGLGVAPLLEDDDDDAEKDNEEARP